MDKNTLSMNALPCPDCGPDAVNHFTERFEVTVNWLLTPFERILGGIRDLFLPLRHVFGTSTVEPFVLRTLAAAGIGRFLEEPDDLDNHRTTALWESANRRGISLREFRLMGKRVDLFLASFEGRTVFFEGLPRPDGDESPSLNWMDDKGIMKKRFGAAGIPVAKGGAYGTEGGALRAFRALSKPVITKPSSGSRSRHTTVHIETEEALIAAFRKAKMLSPWVIVEEELRGFVFRASVIGGKVAGILRREPAYVTGDGKTAVRALLERENRNPLRQGPIFRQIPAGDDATRELARQGLLWESVPRKDAVVLLGNKTSRGVGGGITNVTETAHPDNIALFERIAAYLDNPIVGIDFMAEDMARSWKEQDHAGVLECNSLPFLDLHHHVLVGTSSDVSGILWELVFPNARVVA